MTSTAMPATPATTLNTKDMRRIIGSSFIGSAIEYYDFLLYATASSLVLDKVFFSGLGPGFALFASFATLAVGYVARPLGGLIFGHFGDLVGRKRMLVFSMLLMGFSTLGIGMLPTTAQIGVVAPVTLTLLRIVQGIAVGGEWGGAALMALEHAPMEKRGFAAGFVNAGGAAGSILATLVLSLFAAISGSEFLEWGWRIPFLLSAALVGVGLMVRLKVAETPAFQRLEMSAEKRRVPILDVLAHSKKAVILGLLATAAFYSCQAMTTVWGVSAATAHGVDKNSVLNLKAVAAVLTMVATLYAARLSDRIGRKPVFIGAALAGALLAYPILALLTNGTVWGFGIAVLLGNGLVQAFLCGPITAYVVEQFPARSRYSGASLAYQGGSMIGAGFTPAIAEVLGLAGGGITLIALFWAAILCVAAVSTALTQEGRGRVID